MLGYSSVGNYQRPWAFLDPDSSIVDGSTATGATSSTSPPNDVTAGNDVGSVQSITDITLVIGWSHTLTYILEWSTDSTTWSTTGISLPATADHGGVFSVETITLSGLSLTAQYLRLSVENAAGGVSVRELTIPTPVLTVSDSGAGADLGFRVFAQVIEAAAGADRATWEVLLVIETDGGADSVIVAERVVVIEEFGNSSSAAGLAGGTVVLCLTDDDSRGADSSFLFPQVTFIITENPTYGGEGVFNFLPTVQINEPYQPTSDGAALVFGPGACTPALTHSGVVQDWTVTGTVKSIHGSAGAWSFDHPLRNMPVTAFFYTYKPPQEIKDCLGTHCVYWTVEAVQGVTDEGGHYSFSKSGLDLDCVEVALGKWIPNPDRRPNDCKAKNSFGDALYDEFIVDHADPAYRCFFSSVPFPYEVRKDVTGGLHPLSSAANVPNYNYFAPGFGGRFFKATAAGGSGDSTTWNIDYGIQNGSFISLYANADGVSYDVSTFYTNQGQGKVRVTDSYGASGICSITWPVGNLGLPALKLPDSVDYFYLSKVELLDFTLTRENIIALGLGFRSIPYPEGPPTLCGSRYAMTVTPGEIDNTKVVNRINGAPWLVGRLGDFNNPENRERGAAAFKGTVVYAWATAAGALKVAVHRSMMAHLGQPDQGWLPVQTLYPSDMRSVQVGFLHNGWCRIAAGGLLGLQHTYLSKDFGATWTLDSGFAVNGTDYGQGITGAGGIFSNGTVSTLYFYQVRDNKGATYVTSLVHADETGYYSGCAYLGTGWALLANWQGKPLIAFVKGWPSAEQHLQATLQTNIIGAGTTATKPIIVETGAHGLQTGDRVQITHFPPIHSPAEGTWTITKIDFNHFSLDGSDGTGGPVLTSGQVYKLAEVGNTIVTQPANLTGIGVGLCRGAAGSLVMLLYNRSTKRCRLAWSGDKGAKWAQMDTETELVPRLDLPPALVALEGGNAAIVWNESDVPMFALTLDSGRSFT